MSTTQKTTDVAGVPSIVSYMVEHSKTTEYPLSTPEATKAFALMREAIEELLKHGQKIQIPGFMTLIPTYVPPRKIFNIVSKKPSMTRELMKLTLKPGNRLRSAVEQYDDYLIKYYKDKHEQKS